MDPVTFIEDPNPHDSAEGSDVEDGMVEHSPAADGQTGGSL